MLNWAGSKASSPGSSGVWREMSANSPYPRIRHLRAAMNKASLITQKATASEPSPRQKLEPDTLPGSLVAGY